MLFSRVKGYLNQLGHQLSAKEELLLNALEKEFQDVLATLAIHAQKIANLEDIKIELPKERFLTQKNQSKKKDEVKSEDYKL